MKHLLKIAAVLLFIATLFVAFETDAQTDPPPQLEMMVWERCIDGEVMQKWMIGLFPDVTYEFRFPEE